jgi:hypothetical protein
VPSVVLKPPLWVRSTAGVVETPLVGVDEGGASVAIIASERSITIPKFHLPNINILQMLRCSEPTFSKDGGGSFELRARQ